MRRTEPDPFAPLLHRLEVAARSHVGLRRDNNEDSVLVGHAGSEERHLFDLPATPYVARSGEWFAAVCDGMGGEAGGEVASRLATVVLDAELKRRPRSASTRMANCPSTGTRRTASWPRPSRMTALSTDECACSEQYTRSGRTSDRAASPRCLTSSTACSRAAARPCSVEIDAVS